MAKTAECPECKLKFDPRGLASHRTSVHGTEPAVAMEHARQVAKEPGAKPLPPSSSAPASSSASARSPIQPPTRGSSKSTTNAETAGSSTSRASDRDPLGLERTFDRLFGG